METLNILTHSIRYPTQDTPRHNRSLYNHYNKPTRSAAGPDAADEHFLPIHNVLVLSDTTMSRDGLMTLWQFPDPNDCRLVVSENVTGLRHRRSSCLLSRSLGLLYDF